MLNTGAYFGVMVLLRSRNVKRELGPWKAISRVP